MHSKINKTLENNNELEIIKKDVDSPPIRKAKRKSKKRITGPTNFLNTNEGSFNYDLSKKKMELNNNANILEKSTKNSINMETVSKKLKKFLKMNDYELNILNYNDALKNDKRKYLEFYISLIRTKHIILSLFAKKDYNSFPLKISFFFFSFTLYFAVNALFFSDSTMHKIKEDEGSFNFIYQIPHIMYSSFICSVINAAMKSLYLTEINVIEVKEVEQIDNIKKIADSQIKSIFYKSLGYFISSSVLLLFFWYYLSCFSAIYRNTQLHLLKDTAISFGLSLIYPFGIYLLPGIFRIPALNNKNETLFQISKILLFI